MYQKYFWRLSVFALLVAGVGFAGSAAAQSGIEVHGLIDNFVGKYQMSGSPSDMGMHSGGMSTSFFGIGGSEDLGGGLKARFLLNGYLRSNTGENGRFEGDPLYARDSWVGLSGSFGDVTLGRNLAPNFLPMIRSTPFGDSFGFAPIILHYHVPTKEWEASMYTTDTAWSNQISYTTPTWKGLTANISYQLDSEDDGRRNWGGNVLYDNGPLSLSAFYENAGVSNPNPSLPAWRLQNKIKSWMLGGSYDFKFLKMYASYSQIKEDNAGERNDKTGNLGLGIPAGAGTIMVNWAKTKRDAGADNRYRDTASFGYDYYLSKRTDIYAVGMFDKITYHSDEYSFVVGMRHRF